MIKKYNFKLITKINKYYKYQIPTFIYEIHFTEIQIGVEINP